MRQRVAFLRTLLAGKPLLALDEPFASLDAITRAEMQEWLAGALRADPRTVVLVTHDVEEALYLSDRVVVLSARPARIVAELRAPAPRAPDRDAAVTDPAFVAVRERGAADAPARGRRDEALAAPRPAAGGAARRLAARRLDRRPRRRPRPRRASSSPPRRKSPSSLWENRSLLAENAWVTLREILLGLGCALVAGVGFAVADAPLDDAPRRHLPADRRLADDPDHRHRPDPRWSGSASGSARSSSSSP